MNKIEQFKFLAPIHHGDTMKKPLTFSLNCSNHQIMGKLISFLFL